MKNIWKIFQRDMMRIRNNVIAMVVIVGISVVPCLYAWFNIAASWDPYSNTGNLKVAVASVDEGYEGSLIPLEINIGDQVLSALRENTQMEWVFTTEDKATSGVKSGKYYAAIVIPKDFSDKMMSVFSENVEKPEITYYSNAKENAIAPKVTDKGASAVQRQVNEVFIETISNTTLTVLQAVSNMTEASGAETIVTNLNTNLNQIAGDLSASAGLLQSFSDMTGSAQKLLDSTTEFLQTAQQQSANSKKAFQDTGKTFSSLDDALDTAAEGVNTALKSAESVYSQMDQTVSTAISRENADVTEVASTLDTLASEVGKVVTAYTGVRDSVAAIGDKYPDTAAAVDRVVTRLDTSIQQQKDLQTKLQSNAEGLRNATTDLSTAQKELKDLFAKNSAAMSSVSSDYKSSLKKSLDSLSDSLSSSKNEISSLLTQLDSSADGIYKLTGEADSDLTQIQSVLQGSGDLLTAASERITDTTAKLDEMEQSGNFSELESLISGDRSSISTFLAAPVSLKTHKVYEIANYGSSMAPFYSVLSIWIGGIVLVAMLKVNVSETCTEGLKNVKLYQIYFGRFITFMIVGLFQSTLIALGDLLYLGIQCEHPFLFLLGCWFSSIVFVNIIYTLTVSLGDIGKAVSVILLVVQVAGTGGTFPIEVAPSFFQAVYPLLPFTHSMAALRETVGGLYGMNYWIDLGKLAIFLGISLIVGLVLRKPIIKANEAFTEKLEETKLM
ncbi:YhgE/Pip domain-containing protein [uncultured Eubacterium sp.]|uniref:YhgE/Pip domain-containing protein n=1 Tax=uncultured Eubacterium sp. TaxID=165185 RepID=UPI0025DF07A1|nr:YhgE/Pip domain-containing protein [uncultured Eubacterium sp.]MCI6537115.1 YhgE/Pip domain-containing protein [Lachnospiraceae bacterium]